MTKEEETKQIDTEIKAVLAKHPGFALSAVPEISPDGRLVARPILVLLKKNPLEA